jgi:lysozyme
MRNLQPAIDIIKEFEGLRLSAYLDPRPKNPIWTIGWGSISYPNGKAVKHGDTCTEAQANEYMLYEVKKKAAEIEPLLKVKVSNEQFCAMLSFAYNVGTDIDSDELAEGLGDSTLLKCVNRGDFAAAALEFPKWNKAEGKVLPGLVRRRKIEMDLFAKGVAPKIIAIDKSKPQASREDIESLLFVNDVDYSNKVCLVGIRGYYLDSMGVAGANDRGVYDDALFWVTPAGMISYKANCDASKYRKGWGFGAEKGMAKLKDGVWTYQPGIHNGSIPHPAFRQADVVTVRRDGTKGDYDDTGWFGINIHRGGSSGTSSLGCQTVPPVDWESFKNFGYAELKKYGQKTFKYLLIEEVARRKGNLIVGVS